MAASAPASALAAPRALAATAAPTPEQVIEKNLNKDLEAVLTWVGLSSEVRAAFATFMGYDFSKTVHPSFFGLIPESMVQEAVAKFEGPWSTKGALFLAHRVCNQVCLAPSLPDPVARKGSEVKVEVAQPVSQRKVSSK